MSAKPTAKIEKINYQGWPNSYRMTNGEVELVITGDIGPRIIRYAFVGGRNVFHEFPSQLGKSGESTWQNRGGHRLWVAPEAPPPSPITYALDNFPVGITLKGGAIIATPPVEPEAGLQKQLVVKMAPAGSAVEVLHRITNVNPWAIELSAWALTVMAPGGVGFTGLPPRGTHPEMLAPTNPLVIWAFTDLSDKRWQFTRKYILLRQDPKSSSPQKIGSFSQETFGAYCLGKELFVKRYRAEPNKSYPDMGASFEMFTNRHVLELETLGPLTKLEPQATVEHVERWSLHNNTRITKWTDTELDEALLPALAS
jgi:hypothetical protein